MTPRWSWSWLLWFFCGCKACFQLKTLHHDGIVRLLIINENRVWRFLTPNTIPQTSPYPKHIATTQKLIDIAQHFENILYHYIKLAWKNLKPGYRPPPCKKSFRPVVTIYFYFTLYETNCTFYKGEKYMKNLKPTPSLWKIIRWHI